MNFVPIFSAIYGARTVLVVMMKKTTSPYVNYSVSRLQQWRIHYSYLLLHIILAMQLSLQANPVVVINSCSSFHASFLGSTSSSKTPPTGGVSNEAKQAASTTRSQQQQAARRHSPPVRSERGDRCTARRRVKEVQQATSTSPINHECEMKIHTSRMKNDGWNKQDKQEMLSTT